MRLDLVGLKDMLTIAMRAAIATRFGGPDVLKLEDVPERSMGPRDVMVDVRAASLNSRRSRAGSTMGS